MGVEEGEAAPSVFLLYTHGATKIDTLRIPAGDTSLKARVNAGLVKLRLEAASNSKSI